MAGLSDCYIKDRFLLDKTTDPVTAPLFVRCGSCLSENRFLSSCSALVIAAELSDRYITDRFLPDKAIDLVDEACSSMRVQLDSLPEDIDRLQRRVIGLQVAHLS